MNRYILCLLLLSSSFVAFSQKVYFIYLQTEQEQPFFIKMNEKVYSSSSTGYLILSKLKDSTYDFTIGFPQNKWPEQKFSVVVRAKDHGYIVKDFGAKGWGLFDLQSLSIQMSSTEAVKSTSGKAESNNVSAFTEILAKAADDPSLREKPVVAKTEEVKVPEKAIVQEKKEETKPVVTDPPLVKKEEPKTVTKEPVVARSVEVIETPVATVDVKDTAALKEKVFKAESVPAFVKIEFKPDSNEVVADIKEQKPIEAEYKRSVVTRSKANSTPEGLGFVFIDVYDNGVKDTIHILIPNPTPVVKEVKEAPKKEKKFLDISTTTDSVPSAAVKEVVAETKPVVSTPKPVAVNSNCKVVAVEADFLKLRKNMAAETDDDDMVDEARKYFKNKCFTTVQIKNLGNLFLDDLGKYKFFDLAYLFVSDKENFSSLQSELKNQYYIDRFKAMLK
jgi:hypothetical protein